MSDTIGDNSIPRHLLTAGGLTIVMSQLASMHPWIAGLSTFLVLMVVMAMIALKGDSQTTWILGIVSAFLATGACWFTGANLSIAIAACISTLGTGSLAILSWLVCRTSQQRLKHIRDLENQQSDLARELYNNERSLSNSGELPILPLPNKPLGDSQHDEGVNALLTDVSNVANGAVADHEFFDFAMLLLSMQRIGHRLSAELDLSSLVAAIVGTTKELLHCKRSELFLWDQRENRLRNAIIPADPCAAESIQFVLTEAEVTPSAYDWVAKNRRILTRRDVSSGKVVLTDVPSHSLPAAIAPLMVGDELIGLLVIDDVADDGPTLVRMLYILANHCAMGLKNAQLFRRIEEMAHRDSLTGLLNHAAFLDELELLTSDAEANHKTLTLVMGDLDYFKVVNDTYGHQAGDKVLQEVARWWQAVMPNRALLARYGGEEFICALPGEDTERGLELAELLRSSLEAHPVSHNGVQLEITASFGLAEFGKPATHPTRLIRLADKALYRAKESGRNRVESHDPQQSDSTVFGETGYFVLVNQ